jgi:DNA/RNA endonuclease YhcR with UshA esterase domain
MDQALLLKTAIVIALLGLAAISIIVKTTGVEEINIGEAKQADEESTVKITGTVERVTSKEGFSIINIRKEESITVVLFDSINLSKGQKVEIVGKTKEYNGKKELVADSIVMK